MPNLSQREIDDDFGRKRDENKYDKNVELKNPNPDNMKWLEQYIKESNDICECCNIHYPTQPEESLEFNPNYVEPCSDRNHEDYRFRYDWTKYITIDETKKTRDKKIYGYHFEEDKQIQEKEDQDKWLEED